MPRISDIVRIIEQMAKPAYAYEWDNCGFTAGSLQDATARILVTLDVTEDVILEAKTKGCGMIVSHHPLIFKPIRTAAADTYGGRMLSLLYQNKIALYCAHTSLDIAPGGVNDALCGVLELRNVGLLAPREVCGELVACARIGELPEKMQASQLLRYIKKAIGAPSLLYGGLGDKVFEKMALCTGAGEEFSFDAMQAGADVFLTGEIKYHTALELKRRNLPFIAAGHFYTEWPVVGAFVRYLQKQLDVLQYKSMVFASEVHTDPFDVEGGFDK